MKEWAAVKRTVVLPASSVPLKCAQCPGMIPIPSRTKSLSSSLQSLEKRLGGPQSPRNRRPSKVQERKVQNTHLLVDSELFHHCEVMFFSFDDEDPKAAGKGPVAIADATFLTARQSDGYLNLSNRRLQQVPENIWKFNENTFGEEKWWGLNCLRKLILSSNQLHTFDYEAFKAAEAAELAAKPLSKPKRDQDPYDGRERPPFIELAYLDLSANHLVSLPDHVWHLTLLQHLNVSHNAFVSLNIAPSSDNSHSGIQWLSLSDNKLSSIGDSSFRVLGNLTHLNLSNNALTSLPNDAFASFPKLRTLLLSHNKLSELPSLDSNWEAVSASLTELDIGHNLLKAVPNGFKNLTSLTKLDARQNRIADLANAAMSGCSRLTELMLYMNALKSLPEWFTSLKAINSVSFAENSISALPANITTLGTLQRLDISTNDLSDVPAEVGKMTWLRSLNLDGNPLRGWKSSVISGSTEQILQYLFNRLPAGVTSTSAKATGSSSSGSVGTTGSVYVPDNGIVALSKQRLSKLADDAFGTLSALKVKQLKLDQNNLTTLPGAVVETLVNLTLLDVSGNKTFNSLPSSISSCSALTSLSAYISECSSCFGG